MTSRETIPRGIAADYGSLGDTELARLCSARDELAIRFVIASNNQRLFRAAWSILKNRSEAEEAVHSAYISALAGMSAFQGRSSLSTWLTRIVVNEALGRRRADERRHTRLEEKGIAVLDAYRDNLMRGSQTESPEAAIAREQVRKILEHAVANLPDAFRIVFVLREIEGLSSEETSEILQVPVATVKTRLYRGRRRLHAMLEPEVSDLLSGTFPFAGADCTAMAERVLASIKADGEPR